MDYIPSRVEPMCLSCGSQFDGVMSSSKGVVKKCVNLLIILFCL